MLKSIDINCDVGEGVPDEAQLMPLISSCNIACGGHTGDSTSIDMSLSLALKYKVKIGAHPSYPDKKNFGRREMDLKPKELLSHLVAQIELIIDRIKLKDARLHHIKAHGALYNRSANDLSVAEVLIKAVKECAPKAYLFVPAGSELAKMALERGLKVKIEAFADRNYLADLSLVKRSHSEAVIKNKEDVLKHLLKMLEEKQLITLNGQTVRIEADTYCVHGDNEKALEILTYISKELVKRGYKID